MHDQPPKAGMSTGAKIGVGCGGCLVVVLILALFAGCAAMLSGDDGDGGGSGSDSGSDSGGEEGGEEATGIGDTVETGVFAFTVTDVETGVNEVADESGYLTETPDGQYVIVSVTVENIGDESGTFESGSQTLIDGEDREHSTDTAAEITGGAESFLNEVNPGNSVEGELIYDIPADAEPASVELSDFLSLDEPVSVELS